MQDRLGFFVYGSHFGSIFIFATFDGLLAKKQSSKIYTHVTKNLCVAQHIESGKLVRNVALHSKSSDLKPCVLSHCCFEIYKVVYRARQV